MKKIPLFFWVLFSLKTFTEMGLPHALGSFVTYDECDAAMQKRIKEGENPHLLFCDEHNQ